MGHNGFRVVYDHDGGRQRRMQREQGRMQSADSSSIGSVRTMYDFHNFGFIFMGQCTVCLNG